MDYMIESMNASMLPITFDCMPENFHLRPFLRCMNKIIACLFKRLL
jgi:hypothetical protein